MPGCTRPQAASSEKMCFGPPCLGPSGQTEHVLWSFQPHPGGVMLEPGWDEWRSQVESRVYDVQVWLDGPKHDADFGSHLLRGMASSMLWSIYPFLSIISPALQVASPFVPAQIECNPNRVWKGLFVVVLTPTGRRAERQILTFFGLAQY